MTVRRLQEVTNDPTSPILTIDDATGAIKAGATSINSGASPTTARTIATTAPLTGGGDLSANRTFAINNFTVDSGAGGAKGAVPAPASGDGAAGKVLTAGAGWAKVNPPHYTVALLPAGAEGDRAYATDGLKVGELTGAGTGVPVYFSNTKWRVFSTDAQVAS